MSTRRRCLALLVAAPIVAAVACGAPREPTAPPPPLVPSSRGTATPPTPLEPTVTAEPSAAAGVEAAAPTPQPSPPTAPARARLTSVGQTTWIRPRPEIREGAFLGYVRTGSSIELASDERVHGPGCPGGFVRVVPRGFVCRDRTVSLAPEPTFAAAAEATRGGPGPLPYGYAISNGTPMYNRVPTPKEQERYERWLGAPGTHAKLPLTLRSHEALAVEEPIPARHPVPSFLEGGGSARTWPFDLVEQTIPLGSMLSYTRSFEAAGRTWLLAADHTIVPADRVRPFRPSTFEGTAITAGGVELPIAWMRERARPRYEEQGGRLVEAGTFAVRTFVPLTGARREERGRTFLAVRGAAGSAAAWVAELDATVVDREAKIPNGVQPGQKWVVIRLTQGTLVAYEGLEPRFATLVSPGAGGVPTAGADNVKNSTTPTGTYYVTFKDRAATMSPEKGKNRSFWIADVPHTQYFHPPFALHAAYWHERFGEYVSAGCINLSPRDAEHLFGWSDPPVPDGWQGATGAGARENGPTTAVVVRR